MKHLLRYIRIVHGTIYERFSLFRYMFHLRFQRIFHPKTVFLILTPEHGNLGDHAIARAEAELLESLKLPFIEITGSKLVKLNQIHRLNIMNGRTILINGGGNLGTLWFSVEQLIRTIIIQNPRSKIVILPSTIYYEDSDLGRGELQKSAEIYNAHSNLLICLRERQSYDIAIDLYRDVRLMPDMAMYLDYSEPRFERNGCILCLRSDHERTLSEEERASVLSQATALFGDRICYRDMIFGSRISPADREKALEQQFEAFKRAELVITDRLHGMIFCAITGTPCIVLNSKSHKVRGCYEWLKHLDYIRICDNIAEIGSIYQSIPSGPFSYDNHNLLPYYSDLISDLQRAKKHHG